MSSKYLAKKSSSKQLEMDFILQYKFYLLNYQYFTM
mgnify:CR=1 FL=1